MDTLNSPEALLKVAEKEDPNICGPLASDYVEIIHKLREEKHFTWKDVEKWFEKHDLPFSDTTLTSVYRKWKQKNGIE